MNETQEVTTNSAGIRATTVGRRDYEDALSLVGRNLSRPLKSTALAISTFAYAMTGGGISPSIPTLGNFMNYSNDKRLAEHVHALEQLGWLTATKTAPGSRRPTEYRLSVPDSTFPVTAPTSEPGLAASSDASVNLDLEELQRKADAFDMLVALGVITED